MEPAVLIALIALLGSGIAATPTIIGVIRNGRTADKEAEVAEATSKAALDKQIDDRIAGELERAYKRIEALETDVKTLKESERTATTRADAAVAETATIKNVVRRWFNDLTAWDAAGRKGRMPLPNAYDLQLLEITPEGASHV